MLREDKDQLQEGSQIGSAVAVLVGVPSSGLLHLHLPGVEDLLQRG
jgi:hypothetical protein